MILDTLAQSALYTHLGDIALTARMRLAFDYLKAFSPDVADGRYDVNGDAVFALVQSYATVDATQKKLESHRQYLDIQYVAEGLERIQHVPVDALVAATSYVPEKDCTHYRDSNRTTDLILGAGSFAIFFPNDGHKPGCSVDGPVRVKKVVMKVRA